MAAATDPEFLEIIIDTLRAHSGNFAAAIEENAREANIEASSGLLNSFRSEVRYGGDNNAAATLSLEFEQHGRFLDMKRRRDRWKRQPPVDDIIQWIHEKGAGKFLSGYDRELGPGGTQRAIENIAWAIAKTVKEKGLKRRRWYSNKREKEIDKLFDALVDKYQEYVLTDQKKQLKNVSTKG